MYEEALLALNKGHIIALGFFDGIHLGHAALIKRTVEIAEQKGLAPSIITFDAHPLTMVCGKNVPLITSAQDRTALVRRMFGISEVIVLRFDDEMMRMPWNEFLDMIVSKYSGEYIVCGHDHSFGYKGEGNTERLKEYCAEHSLGCEIVPPVMLDGQRVSSTIIREMIAGGDIENANRFLGHRHILTDTVRQGRKLGRTIDAPTINMQFGESVIVPKFGVYATIVTLEDGTKWRGVTNVGVRPTVDDSGAVTAETYILGYSGDLYGRNVTIEFCRFMRPEMKFDNVEQLKNRIHADADNIDRYFSKTEQGV